MAARRSSALRATRATSTFCAPSAASIRAWPAQRSRARNQQGDSAAGRPNRPAALIFEAQSAAPPAAARRLIWWSGLLHRRAPLLALRALPFHGAPDRRHRRASARTPSSFSDGRTESVGSFSAWLWPSGCRRRVFPWPLLAATVSPLGPVGSTAGIELLSWRRRTGGAARR